MNLQQILNDLCHSFSFDESRGLEDSQFGGVINFAVPPLLSPDYCSAQPPPAQGSVEEYY